MPSRLFEHHLCPSLDLSDEDKSVSSHFSPSLAALRAHGTEASTQWPGLESFSDNRCHPYRLVNFFPEPNFHWWP